MTDYAELFADAIAEGELRRLGWGTISQTIEYDKKTKKPDSQKASATTAVISSDIDKLSRKAVDSFDIVFADGQDDDAARKASESWTVDLIVNCELNKLRDGMYNKNSGLDHVMCAFMSERDIGYCVNVKNILDTTGMRRAILLGRINQNLMLCKKYKVRIVLSCGAKTPLDARTPQDLMNLGKILGLSVSQSRDAVSKNPMYFLSKAKDRNDPDIIMRGVRVKSWGGQKAEAKRRYGWY